MRKEEHAEEETPNQLFLPILHITISKKMFDLVHDIELRLHNAQYACYNPATRSHFI